MPIYEYRCTKCDHLFEELVQANSDAGVKCPKCDAGRVERLPSVFSARVQQESSPRSGGGCGRCGDPNGPCGE